MGTGCLFQFTYCVYTLYVITEQPISARHNKANGSAGTASDLILIYWPILFMSPGNL